MRQSPFAVRAVNLAQRIPAWVVLITLGATVGAGACFSHLRSSDNLAETRRLLLSYAAESAKRIDADRHLLVMRRRGAASYCQSIASVLKDVETSNPFKGRLMLARTLWLPGRVLLARRNLQTRKARAGAPSIGQSTRKPASGFMAGGNLDAKETSEPSSVTMVPAIEGVKNTTSDDQSIGARTQALDDILRAYETGGPVVSEIIERGGELAPPSSWLYAYAPIEGLGKTRTKGKTPAKTAAFLELALDVSKMQRSISPLSMAVLIVPLIIAAFVGAVKVGIISSDGYALPSRTPPTQRKTSGRQRQRQSTATPLGPDRKNPVGSPRRSLDSSPEHRSEKKFLHLTAGSVGVRHAPLGHAPRGPAAARQTGQRGAEKGEASGASRSPVGKRPTASVEAETDAPSRTPSPNETTGHSSLAHNARQSVAEVSGLRNALETATVHYTRGKAFLKEGDVDHALNEFRAASELAPDEPKPLRKLAEICLVVLKDDEKAVGYLEALAKLDRPPANGSRPRLAPRHVAFLNQALDVLCERGRELCRAGKTDEAKARFEWALRIDPDNADARKNLDDLLVRTVERAPTDVNQATPGATASASESKGGDESAGPTVRAADEAMIQRVLARLRADYSENELSSKIEERVMAKVRQRIEDEIANRVVKKLDDKLDRIVSEIVEKIF